MTEEYTLKIFKKLILFITFSSLFLSGCSDSFDINKKTIATTVAVDKRDGEVWLYIEYANTDTSASKSNGGGGSVNKFSYLIAHGKSLIEARDNLDMQLQKPLYLSGVRTLVLTEAFAEEYLLEYLNRLRAEETYRKRIITVITKENPEKLLDANNEKNQSLGFSIEEMLKTLENSGKSFSRMTSRLNENLSSTYSSLLVPCIGMENKHNILKGYSIIKGTKVDGFISVENSKGLINLKADKPILLYSIPNKDDMFTVEVSLKNRKVDATYKNKEISFEINCEFEAKLLYGDKKIPYNFNKETNAEITKILNETLKNEMLKAIEQSQKEFECDYFQLDDEFQIKYPDEFKKMDWETEYLESKITIKVKTDLTTTWMMDYSSYKT